MKNIKFYSALALSIVAVSAFSTVASAEDTKSSVELSPDTGNGASKVLPTDPLNLSKDLLDSIYATGKKPEVTAMFLRTTKQKNGRIYLAIARNDRDPITKKTIQIISKFMVMKNTKYKEIATNLMHLI